MFNLILKLLCKSSLLLSHFKYSIVIIKLLMIKENIEVEILVEIFFFWNL